MNPLPTVNSCVSDLRCEWAGDYHKHLPHRNMKRSDTRHGPASYLAGTKRQQVQAIENDTVRQGKRQVVNDHNSEYLRDVGKVIGWDAGKDATWSFVECSGGLVAGRRFHGRPMAASNHKLGGTQ